MNWDRIEGQWKQRRGKAMHRWGKLMNDELATIAGKHEQLVGILQEKYGVAKEQAQGQIDEFKHIVGQLKRSNADLIKLKMASAHKTAKPSRTPAKAQGSPRKRSS